MPRPHRHLPSLGMGLLLLTTACASTDSSQGDWRVLASNPARLLEPAESAGRAFPAACTAWALSPAQVSRFFTLARELPHLEHHRFDYLPCEISGELLADEQRWHFRINAAGTASWQRQGQVRHFACTAPACEPLVLMLPEPGDP